LIIYRIEQVVNLRLSNPGKDKAEFWIQKGGRFILIRYFPLYNQSGKYRGVLEVSQDATEIRSLQGERRLLDWTRP
jgi:DUF438 domain-containing protein